MTTATPKPRAGEHMKENRLRTGRPSRWTPYDDYVALQAERDLLRERERGLVEALAELAGDIEGIYDYCKHKDLMVVSIGQFRRLNAARAILAKHGR